jgi:hypothetical protein
MNNRQKFVVFDIDGTISDPTHRMSFAFMKDWSMFNERAYQDPVIVKMADLMRELSRISNIMLLTGRNEKYRHITLKWLRDAELDFSFEELIMRPDFDYRSDSEVKIELLEKRFGGKENVLNNIWFAIEDRDQVVEEFRNYGLTVLQPTIGGY